VDAHGPSTIPRFHMLPEGVDTPRLVGLPTRRGRGDAPEGFSRLTVC
jgi:hypothetical protein